MDNEGRAPAVKQKLVRARSRHAERRLTRPEYIRLWDKSIEYLYVFAAYRPEELEGFCEGPLGTLLAAQEDVVLGAVGGFRRYKADSGPFPARQPEDAVLQELDGVNFAGRTVAYAPRTGAAVGEENARYHEAESAARWLVERQGGSPGVAAVDDAG